MLKNITGKLMLNCKKRPSRAQKYERTNKNRKIGQFKLKCQSLL